VAGLHTSSTWLYNVLLHCGICSGAQPWGPVKAVPLHARLYLALQLLHFKYLLCSEAQPEDSAEQCTCIL
jgi:hypothetical protein